MPEELMPVAVVPGALSEVRRINRDAPMSASEAAAQAAVAYYAQQPGDSRSLDERRDAAIGQTMEVLKSAGPAMQESYMRALMVTALLESGQITRLPPVIGDDALGRARVLYAESVGADSRLALLLQRGLGVDVPASEGEGVADYFNRLAGVDFDKGPDACGCPALYSNVIRASSLTQTVDEDGVVDEERVSQENLHLIEQALRIRLRSEAQALGLDLSSATRQEIEAGDECIDLAALALSPHELGEGGASQGEYPRQR